MSKLLFTMTDAGRQELVNANKTGTNKVEIVSVGLGSRYYVTSTSQTNITDEIKRLTTIGGKVVSPDTIHVTAKDDSKDEYVVHTIGLYTNKGTLFAVYSQEQAIINKASSTIALISSDIAIKTLDTKNITFGDIEFINPPATETVVGVARFANEQEIDAGTDDSLAVSAKRLKQAIVKHEQSRNHPDATLTSKGFVQLSSATNSASETLAATPKAVKAAYDLANGKYTAQDATTARKGIVQLSSATDSQREDRAATSKAVSEAMENAEGRLSKEQNGRDILDKASFVNNVGAARAYGRDISLGAGEWTTSEFVAWLKENGAFDQPYWMMKASLPAVMNKVITDTGLGKINLGGCAIEVMGTYDAAIVRVTIGEYGMTGFLNGTVCTCTVYGDTQRFYWRADYTTKNKPDAASTTQKGVVQLTSATDSTSETLAATAKAVKIAMDNASARLAKDRNGADIPNKPLFIQNVGLRELGTSGEKIPLLSTANTWTNRQTFSGGLSGELSGNASTAAKLKTARKISNVAFDGSSDITLKASHVGAFALGKTGSTVANDKAVGWNWSSGAYNATFSGASTLILHFYMGEGSCPAAQFRINYKNGGIFYRSARDGYGFEADWSEFYTTTRKPSAGDVGALPLSGGQLNGALGIGTSSALGGNSIVLGDNDTGFKQNGDGNLDVYANNVHVMRFVSGSIQSNKTINITGRVNPSDYGNFDSRYVKDVRLGSQQYYGVNNWQTWNFQCPSGHVLTGINVQDTGSNSADNIAGVYYRPVQKYINGTWYNVASV
ncbi:tail fiber protein [Escherichia coli]|uniref:tail fiber protein n=2 Tax=Escherichia coli TaxID=562 RepID=UPI000BE5C7B5|nr:tail fiber protein [Escherichia coli]EEQ7982857.1 phage tail protein [Escherichia coli]EEQ8182883.1 phage tail protein [Escherichia coli]EHW6712032.1 tail fiber protein [Escherichia coli]EII4785448.1 tail fiber protein [Escherichia coli]